MTAQIESWLGEAARAVQAIDAHSVQKAADALANVRARGGTIYVIGNGGSATTATHLALDLQKAGRALHGRGTRAIALTDNVGLLTAWANDTSYDRVFAEQLSVLAEPGDALVVISVSGSSPNLIAALETSRERGIVTIGLLGGSGGAAVGLVDHAVIVPSADYGWVESGHVVLHHVLTYFMRAAAEARDASASRQSHRS